MADINNEQNINITNSKDVKIGDVNNIVNASQTGADELSIIFSGLLQKAEALEVEEERRDAKNAIQALEQEAKKQDKANEKSVGKWFRFLAETAPDIGQVAIETFLNPIKGVSLVFQKVAERAKAERLAEEQADKKE